MVARVVKKGLFYKKKLNPVNFMLNFPKNPFLSFLHVGVFRRHTETSAKCGLLKPRCSLSLLFKKKERVPYSTSCVPFRQASLALRRSAHRHVGPPERRKPSRRRRRRRNRSSSLARRRCLPRSERSAALSSVQTELHSGLYASIDEEFSPLVKT
jgi:hypothetical protein